MLTVEGLSIHVMEAGRGRPVLLVHGNPTWGFLYRKVAADLLGEPVRLVIPDLPGLGFSARIPAAAHRLESHVRWMAGVVRALDLHDVVAVVQDWGGPIGVGAFLDQPERLAGLVVLNTVLGPPRPGFNPTLFHRFARMPGISTAAFRGLGFPQNVLAGAQGDRRSIRGDVARAYRWPLRGLSRNAAPLALARMVPDSQEHPSIPVLTRIQTLVQGFTGPAGIVWGRKDPVLGPALRRVRAALPRANVTETDAGHFLQEEVPEEIAGEVRRIVRTLRG